MNIWIVSFYPFPWKGKKFMVRSTANLKRSPLGKGRSPIGKGVCKIIIKLLNYKEINPKFTLS